LVRVISWIVLFLWKKGTIHEITRTKHETHYRLNLLLRQSQTDRYLEMWLSPSACETLGTSSASNLIEEEEGGLS